MLDGRGLIKFIVFYMCTHTMLMKTNMHDYVYSDGLGLRLNNQ
jgi:hypothetical protein